MVRSTGPRDGDEVWPYPRKCVRECMDAVCEWKSGREQRDFTPTMIGWVGSVVKASRGNDCDNVIMSTFCAWIICDGQRMDGWWGRWFHDRRFNDVAELADVGGISGARWKPRPISKCGHLITHYTFIIKQRGWCSDGYPAATAAGADSVGGPSGGLKSHSESVMP